MGSSSSAPRQEARAPQPAPAQLSLPIQNRRTRAVTLSVEPREGAAEVAEVGRGSGVCLPIKNRRTRGVILEAAEFNPDRLAPPGLNIGRSQDSGTGDMTRRAVHNPVGYAFAPDSPSALVPRLPSSPADTSSARTSSVPISPSVMSRNSRVHFAASPASVVEITPYSWTSRSSAFSPTSPTFAADSSPTSLNAPQTSQGVYGGTLQHAQQAQHVQHAQLAQHAPHAQHAVVIPAVQYVQHYAWTAPSVAPSVAASAPVPALPVVSAPPLPLASAVPANIAVSLPISLPKPVAPPAAAAWRHG
ncbi:rqcd1 [Symbiodinium natans]|uniref:Rqcd1 protein n=1 Tax=Symbiodinium natans TaxID=878477 RepID=A0A812JU58_9DINO|nr:rqcd1 [Symbiodinium natans]